MYSTGKRCCGECRYSGGRYTRYGKLSPMIGLSSRSSRSRPCSGSEASTGVPRTLGAGVAVAGTSARVATAVAAGSGVSVGGRVGRGVWRIADLSEVGVAAGGGGAGGVPIAHAVQSASTTEATGRSRRRMPSLDSGDHSRKSRPAQIVISDNLRAIRTGTSHQPARIATLAPGGNYPRQTAHVQVDHAPVTERYAHPRSTTMTSVSSVAGV